MARLPTRHSRPPGPSSTANVQPPTGNGQSPDTTYNLPPALLAGFVLTGIVTTLLGPVLPVLSAKWSLSDARAGYLFASQFLGSSAGTIVSAFIIARLGFGRSLAFGFGVMALGVAALGLAPWPSCLAAVAAYGLALGLTIPAANLLVSESNPERPAAALNFLNAAWSIGAVLSPPLVALLIVPGARTGHLLGLAAVLAIVALWIPRAAILHCPKPYLEVAPTPPDGKARGQNVAAIPGRPDRHRFDFWAWLRAQGFVFAALFFLYVGIENSVGGWAATYARRMTSQAGARWELAPSLFWGTLIFGRILAPTILRYISEAKLVVAGLLVTTLGVAALLISKTLISVLIGVSLAGLGLSSVFPITIAMLTQCFDATTSPLAGPMFAFGGLGGACLPWLVGFLSSQFNSLRVGLCIPLLATLVMLALQGLNPHASKYAEN